MPDRNFKAAFLATALGAFAMSLLWPGAAAQCVLSAILVMLIALRDPRALTQTGSLKFWLFPLAFVLLSPFMAGEPDLNVFGLAYSKTQLDTNALFIVHAYCFVIMGAYYGRNHTLSETVELGRKLGLKTLGLRLALAICATKKLELMTGETFRTYARTRPGKRERLLDFAVLAGAVIRNTVLIAEDIAVLLFIRKIEL
ncbi:MAG: hypothetical protein PHW69_07225 [Elusimicrobiaceae bacterium]|nr:hypothetical protein [Elusimicrobiaceae bacterium]